MLDLVHRERDADDTGRGEKNLLRRKPESGSGIGSCSYAGFIACLSRAGIRNAAVHDDRLRRPLRLHDRSVPDHRCSLDKVRREGPCKVKRNLRDDHGHVFSALLEPGADRCCTKALCGCNAALSDLHVLFFSFLLSGCPCYASCTHHRAIPAACSTWPFY